MGNEYRGDSRLHPVETMRATSLEPTDTHESRGLTKDPLSGSLAQLPAFPLGKSAPDAESFVVVKRVLEAL
jgi:hypothetical protein